MLNISSFDESRPGTISTSGGVADRSRTAKMAGDDVPLEGDLEAFRGRVEVRQRSPIDGDSPVSQ